MNLFYRTVRTIFRPVLRVYNRMEILGLEHVPETGPCIVVANHHSYMDSFVLGAACPRKIVFMVKASQYYKPWMRWFYWGMDAFSVNQGRNDLEAMRRGLEILARGAVLGIFPAGSRRRQPLPGPWMDGVGSMARKTGVPVVPAALIGTFRAMPPGSLFARPLKVRVVFGAPVRFEGGRGRRAVQEFVEELRLRVERMLRTGVPALDGAASAATGEGGEG